MRKSMRFLLGACLAAILVVEAGGCVANKTLRLADQELYSLGQAQFGKKKYIKARETFTFLVDYYPDSKFAADAQLLKADSFFKERNYIEAEVEYGLFMEFHPAHPKADYALFQQAECAYKHIRSVDRDQTSIHETVKLLKQLGEMYPQSLFVPQAKERIIECEDMIHEHSLYVARFYYRWKDRRASIYRYELLLRQEPPASESLAETARTELAAVKQEFHEILIRGSEKNFAKGYYGRASIQLEKLLEMFDEEKNNQSILYRLGLSYLHLKQYDKAKTIFQQILDKFPDGEYAPKAHEGILQAEEDSGQGVS